MNVFDLMAKISLDKSEYDNGLKEADSEASSFGSKIGAGLATAAKVGAAAIAGATTAVTALVKQSVDSYGTYQQMVGGAQLMFGDAYDTVAQNAANAYKTVQMSASDYMQQANGFATGLKTALGGNAQAAAELSHKIIQAEADIVAATGNSQENVQNAFNGIMRSNFTMLDNLQIGITPTKEGFQEVIDKVNEWNAANGEATKYQMGNLADMQSALVDYIEMVGYAGYAGMEAGDTLQGSLSAARAAWDNLVTGFADPDADLGQLMDNLVESIVGDGEHGLLNQIIPVVENAIRGVGEFIAGAAPIIGEYLPGMIAEFLPALLEAAISLVTSVAESLPGALTILISAIIDNAPLIVQSVMQIITTLVAALPQMITLITAALPGLVTQIANTVVENAPALLAAGVAIIEALGEGILSMVDLLNTDITSDVDSIIAKAQEKLPEFLEKGVQFIEKMATGILNALPTIVNNLTTIISKLFELIVNNLPMFLEKGMEIVIKIALGLIQALPQIIQSLGELITNLLTTIVNNLPKFIESGMTIVAQLVIGLVKAIPSIISTMGQLVIQAINVIKATNWIDIGKNIVQGLINGVKAMASAFIDAIVSLAQKAMDRIKSFFGIHSPSTVMRDQVGKMLPLGMALGIEDTEDEAVRSAENMSENVFSAVEGAMSDINKLSVNDNISVSSSGSENVLSNPILAILQDIYEEIAQLPSDMDDVTITLNNRELGRLVRAVV